MANVVSAAGPPFVVAREVSSDNACDGITRQMRHYGPAIMIFRAWFENCVLIDAFSPVREEFLGKEA